MTQTEQEMRALLAKIREWMLETTPNTPDNLPDYDKQPYKFIREISNCLMLGATTETKRVMFPCKTCRHFHNGKTGPDIQVGPYVMPTVVDDGCTDDECHCGKITPTEMLKP
jgi:hypothetical protein